MTEPPQHTPSRRTVLAAATATALLTTTPATANTLTRRTDLLYVGTWAGTGIHAIRFDSDTGTMTPLGVQAETTANWLTAHPTRPVLHAAGSEPGGIVRTFRITPTTGALHLTAELTTEAVPGGSGGLSFTGLDPHAETLLVADFATGSASTVAVHRDGSLGSVTSTLQDTGSGPNPRQAGPHVHHVVTTPDGRHALVADFGTDHVHVHHYDRATRSMRPAPDDPGHTTAPGSGPRRLAFHPDGRTVYLLNELTADLEVLAWDPHRATLTRRQRITTNAPAHTGPTSAAELTLSADGRFAYVSNRGDNTLVAFATNPRTRLLTEAQRLPCGGETPWSFTLHPGGRWLFVANKASGTVDLFRVDPRSGRLTATGTSVSVPAADCVAVVRT
jgi:6-phosphogluconolactonase (cycloisomerase 2 family)